MNRGVLKFLQAIHIIALVAAILIILVFSHSVYIVCSSLGVIISCIINLVFYDLIDKIAVSAEKSAKFIQDLQQKDANSQNENEISQDNIAKPNEEKTEE